MSHDLVCADEALGAVRRPVPSYNRKLQARRAEPGTASLQDGKELKKNSRNCRKVGTEEHTIELFCFSGLRRYQKADRLA